MYRVMISTCYSTLCPPPFSNLISDLLFMTYTGKMLIFGYLCVFVALLSSAFCFAGGIAESKNYRTFVQSSHILKNL